MEWKASQGPVDAKGPAKTVQQIQDREDKPEALAS